MRWLRRQSLRTQSLRNKEDTRTHPGALQGRRRGFLQVVLVNITPTPFFARLNRLNNGMFCTVVMRACMFVLGRIATSYMAAREAHTQMNPGTAQLQAVLAPLDCIVTFCNFYLIYMITGCHCHKGIPVNSWLHTSIGVRHSISAIQSLGFNVLISFYSAEKPIFT